MTNKNKVLNAHVLAALAPGAKVDYKKLEIAVNSDPEATTLVLNVGGELFETYKSTLKKHGGTNLSDELFLRKFYRESRKDYFFDRDPVCFRSVLEYVRTGQLHLPSNVCGPALKRELDFWGVNESLIQSCCWNIYDSWNSTYESLLQLDQDRKAMFCMDFEDKEDMNCSTRFRCKLWNILSNHDYSKLAKVYGFISLSFVIMSIFTFIAETHPAFKVPGTRDILGRHHQGITIIPNVSHSMVQEDQQPMIPHHALIIIDIVCLIFFTLEFVLRLTCAPKRVKFFFSFLNMVDLVALLPDYIEVIVINHVHNDSVSSIMHYITILRLIRILRIFRLIRHVSGLWVMMYTLKASLEELMLMCVFLLVGMVIFASLIFFVGEEQFDTIPISLWWALITMTTVGYGDMYPTKNLGYVVGTFCALAGLLMIGFTVPIIVNHFVLFYTHLQSALRAEKRQKIDLKEKEEELKLFAGREEPQKEEVSNDKEIDVGEHADAPPSYRRFMDSLQKCKQNGIRKATDTVTDAELQYLSHSQAKVCENVDGGVESYNSLFQ